MQAYGRIETSDRVASRTLVLMAPPRFEECFCHISTEKKSILSVSYVHRTVCSAVDLSKNKGMSVQPPTSHAHRALRDRLANRKSTQYFKFCCVLPRCPLQVCSAPPMSTLSWGWQTPQSHFFVESEFLCLPQETLLSQTVILESVKCPWLLGCGGAVTSH